MYFIYLYIMKQLVKKTIIFSNIYKMPIIHHITIKYNDTIYIDISNQSTIFHFLHSQNTSSTTNLSQINN